jgi:hypothetical protein
MGTTYIDDASNVTLNRGTTKKQVYLVVIIPKSPKILNNSETGLAVGDGGIHVMLLSVLVNAESFKGQVAPRTELWLHWSW